MNIRDIIYGTGGWVAVIGGALVLTSLLSRRGHRTLCAIARTPLGVAVGIAVNGHVFWGWRRLIRVRRVPAPTPR